MHDRSKLVRACVAECKELVTERFPGYAPKTNPDEMIWQRAKHARFSKLLHPLGRRRVAGNRHGEAGAAGRGDCAAFGVHPPRENLDPVTSAVSLSTRSQGRNTILG